MICKLPLAYTTLYSEQVVQKSTINGDSYETPWLNRDATANSEDPWIDLEEVSPRGPGKLLSM